MISYLSSSSAIWKVLPRRWFHYFLLMRIVRDLHYNAKNAIPADLPMKFGKERLDWIRDDLFVPIRQGYVKADNGWDQTVKGVVKDGKYYVEWWGKYESVTWADVPLLERFTEQEFGDFFLKTTDPVLQGVMSSSKGSEFLSVHELVKMMRYHNKTGEWKIPEGLG